MTYSVDAYRLFKARVSRNLRLIDPVWDIILKAFEPRENEDDLVFMTGDELRNALRNAFLEGQRFNRDHSLEGAIGKATEALRGTARQIGKLPPPTTAAKSIQSQAHFYRPPPRQLSPEQKKALRAALNYRRTRRGGS